MRELNWRKSSHSDQYNCVEVALSPHFVAVRDSKAVEDGRLTVSPARWAAFLRGLESGRFDR
ncbi:MULTISPECIES: DUF397 domain-containing protein [unclassified Saccharopolyspora]|uniref:DUF397 domain-containing protein n=1 Tax=unclassified Saccharopolyspora TaxID=2646250 RepID=UPI001CD3BBF9|nr:MULTISPECIES: DUF397 domain-containing protein [unclassified Saccharopolyspora]MCA1190072.1 DUF397 domain-containing protein [Saccharopolyspora sp. 6T]MCA1193235.1 DUF397 domain-containing protein [Saccharopolyspora sp. 6V]MCA1229463.1 DUF397 domain-containing protein [Saccharopolyspora sp. 6M]MCA1279652.1 DUF397 domain-containing protein [Saccharopolyspora sp. 7B]